eukprot:8773653-Alexandrium_andersonii.AAC.1
MSASLVGSEMCIRDRPALPLLRRAGLGSGRDRLHEGRRPRQVLPELWGPHLRIGARVGGPAPLGSSGGPGAAGAG